MGDRKTRLSPPVQPAKKHARTDSFCSFGLRPHTSLTDTSLHSHHHYHPPQYQQDAQEVRTDALRRYSAPLAMELMPSQQHRPVTAHLCVPQTCSSEVFPGEEHRPGHLTALRIHRQPTRRQGSPGHWCYRRRYGAHSKPRRSSPN